MHDSYKDFSEDDKKQHIEVIISVIEYLDQIEQNRHVFEKSYLENKKEEAEEQLAALMNGLAWLEYTVVLLNMNMDSDQKNVLFDGVKEAIEVKDWMTISDFLSYPLVRYVQLMRRAFSEKYMELTGVVL